MDTRKIMIGSLAAFAVIVAVACLARAYVVPLVQGEMEARMNVTEEQREQQQAGLSAAETKAAEQYSGKVATAADILEQSIWVPKSSGTATERIRFKRGYYVRESDSSKENQVRKFMLEAVHTEKPNANSEVLVMSITTDKGKHIGLLRKTTDGAGTQSWEFSCEGLFMGKSYIPAAPADRLEIDKPADSVIDLFGGAERYEEMKKELADYAATHYPKAKKATWNGKVEIDYKAKKATTHFALDLEAKTVVSVKAPFGGASFEFGRG